MPSARANFLKYARFLPSDRSFCVSELSEPIPGAVVRSLFNGGYLEKVGRTGRRKRFWIWKMTKRAEQMASNLNTCNK